ncbi:MULTISPECIES: DUF58 domain-containing protein [unclassified Paenibacillus]|uniref:DUF58 domain-containing protein n=1 Tax=unclassified Paenibacillus TaxID=185978 RepID=UPI001AEB9601|nr:MULTISPECIES: DUF58 domain-containing protein [unclassified Paenibacillus]MBP1153799.1 uncharacterized protein (DUF58 family) [Paenibacillus sp. PvP091]MBP1170816.1 uncharacterized protein (DUF58 family) [Paenibacillus sp. PvR098]MBP2441844.1 uncharacterized protein (DUF58 family) [Paenibacillus sp. PvP052]
MSAPNLGLDPKLLLRLEQMSLAAKRRIRGTMQGKRGSKQLGASLEFADYRMYAPGDDIRRFDWGAYARTGKPFIKQFMDEQELQVNLYIDVSRSMGFPKDDAARNKLLYAQQLAACVGFIALSGYDRVSARLFSDRVERELPMLRGKGSAHRLFQFLSEAEAVSGGDIADAVMKSGAIPRQPGMTWIFSDFLYETGIEETLSFLLAARQEVVVVQVLSEEEVRPVLSGDLRLIDSEFGTGKEVAVTGRVIEAYRSAVRQYTQSLRRFCHERGMIYLLATTDVPVADTVQRSLRVNGLLL